MRLSSVFYMSGALGTLLTATNDLITVGGIGLTLSAASSFMGNRVAQRLVPAFASVANIALIANGQLMVASALAGPQLIGVALAGTFLTAANMLYLYANGDGLIGSSSIKHAEASTVAGAAIFAAGAALQNPALCAIGGCFAADGALRLKNG